MCELFNGFRGWQATTNIDLGEDYFLCFFTMKRYGGALATTATRKRKTAGGGAIHTPSQDYSEAVITQNKVRVTASAVKLQHLAALEKREAVIARMKAFYASKGT